MDRRRGARTAIAGVVAVLATAVPVVPAGAQVWCAPDERADVAGGTSAAADVLEACADFGDHLTLELRVDDPEDPTTSAAWRGDTAIEWTVRADAPDSVGTFLVRVHRDEDGLFAAYVHQQAPTTDAASTVRCVAPARAEDGWYVAWMIPPSCLSTTGHGEPTRLAYAVEFLRDVDDVRGNGSGGTSDTAPRAGSATVARGPTSGPRDPAEACDGAPEDGASDVPEGSAHEAAIDCLRWWGVARGVGGDRFAPAAPVTRGQMASFVAGVLDRAGVALPSDPPSAYADDDGTTHELAIDQLSALGVVAGVAPGRFAPHAPVSRAQVATFLVHAWEEASGTTLRASADYFRDDDGSPHEDAIDRAAEAGFVAGRDGEYAPRSSVVRAQMASFLVRVLDAAVESGLAPPPA